MSVVTNENLIKCLFKPMIKSLCEGVEDVSDIVGRSVILLGVINYTINNGH